MFLKNTEGVSIISIAMKFGYETGRIIRIDSQRGSKE
jgi:hypothetical protein